MVKRCLFCGRYFQPDPRVKEKQKACFREECRKARKLLAQSQWCRRNPDYFRGRYEYVKQWRLRKREEALRAQKDMIQDTIAPRKRSLLPIWKLIFLMPGGWKRRMIQDEILFKRVDRCTFAATGGGI